VIKGFSAISFDLNEFQNSKHVPQKTNKNPAIKNAIF
jgi:hypothetical protein